jgi:hypothetical protein
MKVLDVAAILQEISTLQFVAGVDEIPSCLSTVF